MTLPPQTRGITFSRSFPFVEVTEEHETRVQHSTMTLLTALSTAYILASPSIPTAAAVIPAFVSGYALCNWAVFPELYEEVPDYAD